MQRRAGAGTVRGKWSAAAVWTIGLVGSSSVVFGFVWLIMGGRSWRALVGIAAVATLAVWMVAGVVLLLLANVVAIRLAAGHPRVASAGPISRPRQVDRVPR
ncbi:hypothetical protein GCM10022255_113020 [Dactylosporangium darangshiense]|uniref:Uncharacterized protein n=1 Tax=Dactylosporangium darangshiense TaxID=579108 RepID=A0ABP8DVM0_9ACTN